MEKSGRGRGELKGRGFPTVLYICSGCDKIETGASQSIKYRRSGCEERKSKGWAQSILALHLLKCLPHHNHLWSVFDNSRCDDPSLRSGFLRTAQEMSTHAAREFSAAGLRAVVYCRYRRLVCGMRMFGALAMSVSRMFVVEVVWPPRLLPRSTA